MLNIESVTDVFEQCL